jgi:hypothetical protein
MATILRAGKSENRGSIPGRGKKLFHSPNPTKPPILWTPKALSPGQSGCGEKLKPHLQLVRRLRMTGTVPSLPLCSLTACAGTVLPSAWNLRFVGYWRQVPVHFNRSAYKTRFTVPLASLQRAHQFLNGILFSKYRTLMNSQCKIMKEQYKSYTTMNTVIPNNNNI